MIYNQYGKTGIEVSAIGFGGMRFKDQEDVESCAELVKAAYDSGINYFDTAIGYGKSEELFGVALKEMQKTRQQRPFYISTKTSKSEPDDIRRDLETSLTRMGLDYIDFYHVWCIMTMEAYRQRKAKGALETFSKLRDEGLIKNVCVSTHLKGDDIDGLLADYPFEGVLMGYSAMNFPYREAGIQAASERGLGVVVMNPLGGGIIPQHPERFDFIRNSADETVVQGALRFLLNDQRITVALVGFSDTDQLREAVTAANKFKPITKKKLAEMRGMLQKSFNEMCTGCCYCDKCPEGVQIPKLMDSYNHYLLSGRDPKALTERLRLHWGINQVLEEIDKCVECGQCEEACTQKLPIIERFRLIRELLTSN